MCKIQKNPCFTTYNRESAVRASEAPSRSFLDLPLWIRFSEILPRPNSESSRDKVGPQNRISLPDGALPLHLEMRLPAPGPLDITLTGLLVDIGLNLSVIYICRTRPNTCAPTGIVFHEGYKGEDYPHQLPLHVPLVALAEEYSERYSLSELNSYGDGRTTDVFPEMGSSNLDRKVEALVNKSLLRIVPFEWKFRHARSVDREGVHGWFREARKRALQTGGNWGAWEL
ncbi:hypothetical protein FB451DRAFT_1172129 [Mycena latifolia]|nr:hypothetical protein FB451DRAFT_1172129 [Mycena latifolia]